MSGVTKLPLRYARVFTVSVCLIAQCLVIDQITHPWNIDDSGEPSQLPHGELSAG